MDGLMFPFNPIKVGMCIRLSIRSSITLRQWEGNPNLGDKSSPEDIRKEFQVSKKVFKQAIGGLYKQGKIKITNEGIELV